MLCPYHSLGVGSQDLAYSQTHGLRPPFNRLELTHAH